MDFVWPMLLGKTEPFSSDQFIYEWKMDGIRLVLIYKKGVGGQCFTRHRTNCTKVFPEISSITFDDNVILDGELIVFDSETGKDDFELVMQRFQMKKELAISFAVDEHPCVFMVFDILFLNGKYLFNMDLLERKKILDQCIQNGEHIQKVIFIDSEGEALYRQVEEMKLEGMVAKRKTSLYQPGKRNEVDWKKIVRYEIYDIVITGYRKKKFGLLCSFITNKGIKPAGVIEFATKEARRGFYDQVNGLKGNEDHLNVYLTAVISGKVKTRGLTKNGYLRTPLLIAVQS